MRIFCSKFYGMIGLICLLSMLAACSDDAVPTRVANPPVTTVAAASPVLPSLPTPSANLKIGYTSVDPVGRVDGVAITAADFNHAVDEARATTEEENGQLFDWTTADNKDLLKSLQQQSFDGLVNYQVVAAEATKEKVTATPAQVQTQLDEFKQQMGTTENYQAWMARRFLTEDDYKQRLAQVVIFDQMSQLHSAVPEQEEQVHVRHILVNTEQEARDLYARLQQGADFASLAKQFSIDLESAPKGGDLDWIFHGQTDPAFESVAFALAPNTFSGPVKTDKGYHLIQSLGKEVRLLPVDLVQQRKQEAFSNYIKSLRDKAKIEQLINF